MAKIPNVNTYARQTKSNIVYDYFFYGPDIQGKRNRVYKGGFISESEALAAGIKARDEIFLNNKKPIKENGDISVADFIYDVWFPAKSKMKKWQDTTKEAYKKKLKNLVIPYIGSYPISAINVEILQDMLDTMYDDKGYSHNSVSNLHGMLCNIFKYAKEHRYIEDFYSDDLQVPQIDEDDDGNFHRKQVRMRIPSEALDDIFNRFSEGTSAYLPMMISLFTGARLGEVFGLTWEDIDFENNIISIRRQMQDYPKIYICNPKYNSKRNIPLCPTLKKILIKEYNKQQNFRNKYKELYVRTYLSKRKNTAEFKNKHGIYDVYIDYGEKEVSFINVYENGSLIFPSVMKHVSRIIHGYSSDSKSKHKKTKFNPIFEDFNTHSLRHTFATALYSQGLDPMLLSFIMGHKLKPSEGMAKITTKYIHLDECNIMLAAPYIDNIYHPIFGDEKGAKSAEK